MHTLGERLKAVRESKHLSQGDVEKRSGMLRCYLSRVENGHTIPSIDTLEKWSRAIEVPLYKLFNDGSDSKVLPVIKATEGIRMSLKERREVERLAKSIIKMPQRERGIIRLVVAKMVRLSRAAK